MIFNVTGGGAGSGGTLVVTAPAGVTCTVSKDGKTKSKTVDQYGYATFKGLDTGTWTVVITDGSQTSPARQVVVTADYDVTMSFFSASIVVTYPEGSICTCSDGSTTLTAPDTSGSYTFTVLNAGEWTVKTEINDETVAITSSGQSVTVDLTKYRLYDAGEEFVKRTGGWEFINNGNGVGTKNESSVDLSYKGSSNRGIAMSTVNPILLDGIYKTLRCKINVTKGNSMCLGCTTKKLTSNIQASDWPTRTAVNDTGEQEVILDISSTTGEQYIAFFATAAEVTIYKFWLE